MNKLRTDLLLSFGGYETSFPGMVVEYTHHRGSPAYTPRGEYAPIDPPEPEHVEIGLVYVEKDGARNPLPEWMIEGMTPDLEAMCLEDWRDRDSYAREQAAEGRHEEDRAARTWQPRAAE
jgi:hypothetical protein